MKKSLNLIISAGKGCFTCCKGCFMNSNESKMPKYIDPVYDDGNIVIRQDAEWPIPVFYN